MNNDTRDDEIKSIARSAKILECISTGKATLTEISNYCNFTKPTVHRLLKALEASGFARKDPITRRHYLGFLIDKIYSYSQVTYEPLITCSIEEMKRLSDVSNETVNLGVRLGISYIQLHGIPSNHDLKVTEESMRTAMVFVGSTAKVLLSQSSDKELEKIMEIIKLEKLTENTVTDKKLFLAQVKQARQQGYSVSYGEKIPQVVGIAAPIKNYYVPAALTILGPEYRLKPQVAILIKELVESVNRISNQIAKYVR